MRMTSLNLLGGGIFDAVMAQAARKISAGRILMLNPSDFTRLDSAIAEVTQVPAQTFRNLNRIQARLFKVCNAGCNQ